MSRPFLKALPQLTLYCLAIACSMLMIAGAAIAQPKPSSTAPPPQPPPIANDDKDDSSIDFGSPESEMRSKLMIKEAKKEYDENVERAREASQLATDLRNSFEATSHFTSEDNKKLERLEKLTRKIRNEAGGSDSDPEFRDIPAGPVATVKRLSDVASELCKLVEKTPRHVISAAVIDNANKLIGLIQFMRRPSR